MFARALIYLFLALFMVTVIYPIYYLLMKSFSTYGGLAANADPFMLTPKGFTLEAYKRFFTQSYIHTGFAHYDLSFRGRNAAIYHRDGAGSLSFEQARLARPQTYYMVPND